MISPSTHTVNEPESRAPAPEASHRPAGPGAAFPLPPLRPPRREEVPAPTPDSAGKEGWGTLDPGTVLAPTRFVQGGGGTAAFCDGRRTVAGVARDAGLDLDAAVGLLSRLYAEGLVCEAGGATVPPLLFLENVRALCGRHTRELFGDRPGLEALFGSGSYTRRLAIGYLVEVTHFVRGAASHIAAAIARAPDERTQLLLARYLEEEAWHGAWMERSLRAAGLPEREIARALPLPSTLAYLNSWRHAAQTDLVLYGGLIAITETGSGDSSWIEPLFSRTVAQGVLPDAAWRPYFEHALADEGADHLSYGRTLVAAGGPLSRARCDALRRALLLHAVGAVQMEHALIDFYKSAEGPPVFDIDWSAEG